jgi:hypothetical protein
LKLRDCSFLLFCFLLLIIRGIDPHNLPVMESQDIGLALPKDDAPRTRKVRNKKK